MRIRVRLFARLRDIAGTSEVLCDVPPGATVRTVWAGLTAAHAELQRYTGVVSCAVNEEYSKFEATLDEGDEVAFLPPVSGGGPTRRPALPVGIDD
jgi:molybdopterin converting factor subunit 1